MLRNCCLHTCCFLAALLLCLSVKNSVFKKHRPFKTVSFIIIKGTSCYLFLFDGVCHLSCFSPAVDNGMYISVLDASAACETTC